MHTIMRAAMAALSVWGSISLPTTCAATQEDAEGLLPAETGLGWTNGWVAAWRSDIPGLEVRDTKTDLAPGVVKVVRRWTWTGTTPLEKVVLSVRYRLRGVPEDLKPFLPGVLLYGNPSNRGRTDGRVPVYGGTPGEFAQFEEHRLPMPFALLEDAKGGRFAAVHVLPSPVRGAVREDLWWSVGVEAQTSGADILLLSGPVGYNGRRSVVKGTQSKPLAYPDAYLTLRPGQIVEKTFWIQTGIATPERFGFESALDASLELFKPYDASRFATFDEIVRRKRDYALTRWRDGRADGACGFDMFDAASGNSELTVGWCGCAATCGYALPVLDLAPEDWQKAQRSLDFIARTFQGHVNPSNGLFAVTYSLRNGAMRGRGDPISCGQGLYSLVKAIRFAEKSGGRLDARAWRTFVATSLDGVARNVLRNDWRPPASTGFGFLVAPLVEGSALFARPDWLSAARKIVDVFARQYVGYDAVYWGGTLDASCEDKEGAYAAFQASVALLRRAVTDGDAAAERRYARLARHAMNMMLTYTMVWDATYPPGRLSDHAFRSTGWTAVSVQNQHLDAFGVLTTPEIVWLGRYLKDERLVRLARVMFRSCFQLTRASGELGEQIQQTNFAQQGRMDDVLEMRGGYAEGWTVFWLTAHFLNAAAQLKEADALRPWRRSFRARAPCSSPTTPPARW